MKRLNIASTFTNISEQYIQEAYDMPRDTQATYIPPRRTFWQRFSYAVNSPLGVACICAVVALGVLAGIVAAGQNASPNPPSPAGPGRDTNVYTGETTPAGDDHSRYFDFSYEIDDLGMFKRGTTYNIKTTITNTGSEITYTGSSTNFFAEATLIYHGGQTAQVEHLIGFEIQAMFPINNDYVTKKIPTGETRQHTGHFIIPDTAPVGQYDLKLSYKNEYIVYKNAVSVYDEERFSFAYGDIDTDPTSIGQFNAGGSITLVASVTNLGDVFTFEGPSDGFVPSMKFVCRGTGYTFHATTSQSDDIATFEVASGQVGKTFYFADIPEDADAGEYDLVLSYGNESRTFYQVIEVVNINTIPEDSREVDWPFVSPTVTNDEEAIEAVLSYLTQQDARYPFDLREDLEASATVYPNQYCVILQHLLGGIATDYYIRATITVDEGVTQVDEASWSKDSYFLQYTNADVQAAIDRITDTRDGAFSFLEEDGKLFVCKEVIIPDDSEEIGHRHIFYQEEVRHESLED